jgi:hypothetical protein
MSRKHYIAIAAMIARNRILGPVRTAEDSAANAAAQAVLDLVAMQSADIFEKDNAAFDRARFLAACGVQNV